MQKSLQESDPHVQTAMKWIVQSIEPCKNKEFAIELWDGTRWEPAAERTRATLAIRDPGAIRALIFAGGTLPLAELYMSGRIDILGEIEALIPLVDYLIAFKPGLAERIAHCNASVTVAQNRAPSNRPSACRVVWRPEEPTAR